MAGDSFMGTVNRKQLRPVEHPGLIRLGVPRDGGYVVPETLVRRSTILLSLGMNKDWSFDKDFNRANAAARVIGVDHRVGRLFFARRTVMCLIATLGYGLSGNWRQMRKSIAKMRNGLDYFRFFTPPHRHIRKRAATDDGPCKIGGARLLEIAGAENDHSVFLKMDIEGSEYELVESIVGGHHRINCIVAEFHDLSRRAELFNQSIERLLGHFRIVHVHGNNYSHYDSRNDFPDSVEITFVNRALISGSPAWSGREYPRAGLDFPNLPRRPDYHLHFE